MINLIGNQLVSMQCQCYNEHLTEEACPVLGNLRILQDKRYSKEILQGEWRFSKQRKGDHRVLSQEDNLHSETRQSHGRLKREQAIRDGLLQVKGRRKTGTAPNGQVSGTWQGNDMIKYGSSKNVACAAV